MKANEAEGSTAGRRAWSLLAGLALLSLVAVGGCSKSAECTTYVRCCKAALANSAAKELFDKKTRCSSYESATEQQCSVEWPRAVAELRNASLPVPPECSLSPTK